MILSQICESMIQMSRKRRWRARLLAIALLGTSGCCGGGSTHKCDFTPPDVDSGSHSDASLGCGNLTCATNQACCVTKTPPFVSCIDPKDYIADGCEKFSTDSPMCASPRECDGGVCCAQIHLMTSSCQAASACPGDGTETYLICNSDLDCPGTAPGRCQILSASADGIPEGFCMP